MAGVAKKSGCMKCLVGISMYMYIYVAVDAITQLQLKVLLTRNHLPYPIKGMTIKKWFGFFPRLCFGVMSSLWRGRSSILNHLMSWRKGGRNERRKEK